MAEIEVHFTEYFDQEAVKILSGTREIYSGEPLKTDVRIGLAKIVKVTVPDNRATLVFEAPAKKISTSVTIEADQTRYVRVTLSGDRLEATPVSEADHRREPRGYV